MSAQRHSILFSWFPLRFNDRYRCPYCGSPGIRREKRHGIIERMVCCTLRVRPYLCYDCDHIHYSRHSDTA